MPKSSIELIKEPEGHYNVIVSYKVKSEFYVILMSLPKLPTVNFESNKLISGVLYEKKVAYPYKNVGKMLTRPIIIDITITAFTKPFFYISSSFVISSIIIFFFPNWLIDVSLMFWNELNLKLLVLKLYGLNW